MADVIQFPSGSGPVFRLQEIVRGSGKGVITAWLAKEPGARARFRVRLNDLRRIPRTDWTKKQFHGLGNGLSEIKWEWGKKQWRAIGFDYKAHFVLVIGCTHKQNVYDPVECLETAVRRKADTEKGLWSIVDYEP